MSENQNKNQNKWQKIIFIIAGGALGILLLLFGGGVGGSSKNASETEQSYVNYDAEEYSEALEKRVAELCSTVKGAGKVTVLVSLKGGYRAVYAVDSQATSGGYKSQVVMSGSGSDRGAVITSYENPQIGGVGIVCDGASNASVRSQLISLVSAALDISTNKIYVAQSE